MSILQIFGKATPAIALSFLLAGCESAEDIERKPDLANQIVATSLERCDLQAGYAQTVSYGARLREVFMEVPSEALDFVIDKGLIICLDQGLAQAETGFWSSVVYGVYYPFVNTLTFYDTGHDRESKTWGSVAAVSYSPGLLAKFAKIHRGDALEDIEMMELGTTRKPYKQSRKYDWEVVEGDSSFEKNNSELLCPPLIGYSCGPAG